MLNANCPTRVVNVPPICSDVSSDIRVLAFARCEAAIISWAAAYP